MEGMCMTPDEKRVARGDGDPDQSSPEQGKLWHETFPQGIDRSRLTQEQLQIWDEMYPEGVTTAFGLWEFGAVCAFELGDVPPQLNDWMRELGFDPGWPIEYLENVRRAGRC
jgi:hypothetical protein